MTRLAELQGRRIHLVGVTSLEIADVACFLGARGEVALVGHDLAEPEALEAHFRAAHIGMSREARRKHWDSLRGLDLSWRLGDDYLEGLADAEVVIVSQAWRLYERNAPLAELAEQGRVRLLTPIELYVALARERGSRTIGVTGSNGKSTTTNMVAHLLRCAGVPVVLAGNYRYRGPIFEALDRLPEGGCLVLEISNHHLLALDDPIDVAVVTNVTPNHLEEHGSFEAYVAVKRRIAERQRSSGVLVLNADDPVSREFARDAHGRVQRFGSSGGQPHDGGLQGGVLVLRDERGVHELLAVDELSLPGDHNVQNALAAALSARAVGLEPDAIGAALRSFSGPPGRLEPVRTAAGVRIVYDIESTTPEATRRGLEAFPRGRVHLIAGGDDKGLDYTGFVEAVADRQARLYLLDGTASEAIREASVASSLAYSDHDSVEGAVGVAWARASEGDVILLSPGALGFYNLHLRDQTSFARIVKRLRRADRGSARPADG